MKKRAICLTLIILIFSQLFIHVGAETKSETNQNSLVGKIEMTDQNRLEAIEKIDLKELNPISVKDFANIYGRKEPLFEVFDNPQLAMERMKQLIPEYINSLAQIGGLKEISDNNWKEYSNLSNSSLVQDGSIEAKMKYYFEAFIDIYENNEVNQEIYNTIARLDEAKVSPQDYEYKLQILIMLPNTSQLFNKLATEIKSYKTSLETSRLSNMARSSSSAISYATMAWSSSSAISYATNYAYSPNTPYYQYWSDGDCTNFASQIVTAAGLYHNLTWYYDRTGGTHRWSSAWSYANSFFNYFISMNSYSTTTDHYVFSQGILAGDFIALDRYNDGSWDHIGFVTQADSYAANYNGKYYYDYLVAQHTSNYHLWASSSNNGWDDCPSGWRYGRIRIRTN